MNKKSIIFSIIIILLTIGLNGCIEDNKLWEIIYDGAEDIDSAVSIDIGPSGNIYVAGWATGLLGPLGRDWWIEKFDPEGNEDTKNWKNIYGKPNQGDVVFSITIDTSENIYAVGYEREIVSPDINPERAWIKKFDSNGNEVWNKTYGGDSISDRFYSVALDSMGNVYVLGSKTISVEQSGGASSIQTLMLIKKFDSNGNENIIHWNKTYGGKYSFIPSSLALDSDNNVYVTRRKVISNDNIKGEILKFDSNNNLLWNKSYDWFMFEGHSFSVTTDTNGNIYVGGYLLTRGEQPTSDWWIKKFDSEGNEDITNWNKTFDGNRGYDYIYSISTDISGNVYVAGNGLNLIGKTGMDWWIKKFDSEGNELWDKRYDGNEDYDVIYSLTVDNTGNIYAAGGGSNLEGSTLLDWWIKKIV
jgi:hypothetical protein